MVSGHRVGKQRAKGQTERGKVEEPASRVTVILAAETALACTLSVWRYGATFRCWRQRGHAGQGSSPGLIYVGGPCVGPTCARRSPQCNSGRLPASTCDNQDCTTRTCTTTRVHQARRTTPPYPGQVLSCALMPANGTARHDWPCRSHAWAGQVQVSSVRRQERKSALSAQHKPRLRTNQSAPSAAAGLHIQSAR